MEVNVFPLPTAAILKVNILLESKEDGGAIASVLEMPSYRVEAATREQAIVELQALLNSRLKKVEILPIEINLPQAEHSENPWVKFAGIFKDDPDFAEIAEAIRSERQAEDDTEVDPSVYMVEN